MPVPMVTLNHEGEKLRTTRRQPDSYLDVGNGDEEGCLMNVSEPPEGSDADTTLVDERVRKRSNSGRDIAWLAGIVMAGLFEAKRRISRSSSSSVAAIGSRDVY